MTLTTVVSILCAFIATGAAIYCFQANRRAREVANQLKELRQVLCIPANQVATIGPDGVTVCGSWRRQRCPRGDPTCWGRSAAPRCELGKTSYP